MTEVKGYRIIQKTELEEMNAKGTQLIHEKSGARICCIENPADSNKVFAISFCTPPRDDTGTPHILEHSVLCGSEKFPLKDPFMELAKGSVNTYLNAMTFSDKTMYPVASQNEQDLYHLMDVYMDAVFHPNILKDPRILMQEGWHHELNTPEEALGIKGVVYNEMKGAFSSPETLLYNRINKALFPDTPYSWESGGDPEAIPTLTQEKFLDFYRTYYHPSNSYIYLYGDMDMEEYLNWLDRSYLQEWEARPEEEYDPTQLLPVQKPFTQMRSLEVPYSVSADHDGEEGYFSYSVGIEPEDAVECFGLDILEYLLLEAQGAPLKKALVESGLGKDIFGDVSTRARQGDFTIVAKGVDTKRKSEFLNVIHDTLQSLADQGLNERLKLAAMNRLEFRLREAEYGTTPQGLVVCYQFVMNSWLYGKDPFQYLRFDSILSAIREESQKGFFENLIRKYLLDNPFAVSVTLRPEVDLAAREDQRLAQTLQEYKKSLNGQQIEELVRTTRQLMDYQGQSDSEEVKKAVPHLAVSDMKPEAAQIDTRLWTVKGVPCWYTEASCSQIVYLKGYLDLSGLPQRLLPYASVLASVLGRMDTEHYTYEELSSEVNIRTGGIGLNTSVTESTDGSFRPEMQIVAKSLSSEVSSMAQLIVEILSTTRLDQTKRLKEILNEEYSQLEMEMEEAGHAIGIQRALSHLTPSAAASQYLDGVEYFLFMKELVRHFDERQEEVKAALNEARSCILGRNRLSFAGGCTAQNQEKFRTCVEEILRGLPELAAECSEPPAVFCPERVDEGLITPGQVQYVVQAGLYSQPYNGSMLVAKQILGLEYLWNRLRVQGGAYGAFAGFSRLGRMYFASYRDPNLAGTLETYQGIPDFLRNFSAQKQAMEKYIIGTIGGLDTPLTPALRISAGTARARTGQTPEMIQKLRDEVLSTTPEKIRGLAESVDEALKNSCICTVGSKEMLIKEKDRFDRVFEVL